MAISFKLSADKQFTETAGALQKSLEEMPDSVKQAFEAIGNSIKAGGSAAQWVGQGGSPDSPIPPSSRPRPSPVNEGNKPEDGNFRKYVTDNYHAGTAAGGQFAEDLNELRSGGFSSLVERKIDAGRNLQEKWESMKKSKAKMDEESGAVGVDSDGGGSDTAFAGAGKKGMVVKSATFSRVMVQRLELSGGAATSLARALGGNIGRPRSMQSAASEMRAGMRSGGGDESGSPQSEGIVGKIGSSLSGMGGQLGVGVAFGIGAAALKLVSSVNQMRNSAMQAQDSSIDALGFQQGGGSLVTNAELAQVNMARARLGRSDRGADAEDVRFGLATGIGATRGAELFSGMQRYGSGFDLKSMLGASSDAGFKGVMQAQFAENLENMAKEAYMSGFGKVDISQMGASAAGLAKAGLRPESAFSVLQNMQQGFQTEGNPMQNLAIAAQMNSGKSYMQALVGAERGATQENMAGVANMLDLKSMDPDMRALVESRLLKLGTATQAMQAQSQGGLLGAAQNTQISMEGQAAANHMMGLDDSKDPASRIGTMYGVGQEYRFFANSIDQMVYDMKNVAAVTNAATEKIIHGFKFLSTKIDDIVGLITK